MPTLYYVHDPMCSWCYAFAPTWQRIESALPTELSVEHVLGGLAPDSDEPMPPPMRDYLQQLWRRIQTAVPGTVFNFDFWTQCTPRRSTYPACRAVLTAKHFDPTLERSMITGIQRAYYQQARNPADVDTLCAVAEDIGLEPQSFRAWLASAPCEAELARELRKTRDLGVTGFPSLILASDSGLSPVALSHTDPRITLQDLERLAAATGAGPSAAR